MCEDLTVELALKRVREGVAGREEADYLKVQIDQLLRILCHLGLTVDVDQRHGG